jgi:hypothetical protein
MLQKGYDQKYKSLQTLLLHYFIRIKFIFYKCYKNVTGCLLIFSTDAACS